MDDDKTIKIQKLKGASNYRIWSAEISAHLEGKGLLNVTLGNELKPNTPRPRAPVRNQRPQRNRRQGGAATPAPEAEPEPAPLAEVAGGPGETPLEKWKRKDAKARSLIMT